MAGRTMLFDVIRHQWSKEILEAVGLSTSKLAIPLASREIAGSIGINTGRKIGFRNPVIVVAGGHDQTCAALGVGDKIWTQLKANVMNKKIIGRDVMEAGCFGAAMLACSAIEKIHFEQLVRHQEATNEIFSPDSETARFYDKKFESYKQLYPAMRQFFKE